MQPRALDRLRKYQGKTTDYSSDFPPVWLPAPEYYLENVNQNLVIVFGTGNRKSILQAREINVINSKCGQLAWSTKMWTGSSLLVPVYSFGNVGNYFLQDLKTDKNP